MCEGTCIHREIVKGLVKYGIILIHSAIVAVDGIAYAFAAKSGVGKSPHIRLWHDCFGSRAVIVNGDKPMFSFAGDTFMVHGTPWQGKEGWGKNISMPVGGFCFLERGEQNIIRKAENGEIIKRLFHQTLIPKDTDDMNIFMDIVDKIIRTVSFYILQCNKNPEAAITVYNEIKINK